MVERGSIGEKRLVLGHHDPECVNRDLDVGQHLGRWAPPVNDCQTFVAQVLADCPGAPSDAVNSSGGAPVTQSGGGEVARVASKRPRRLLWLSTGLFLLALLVQFYAESQGAFIVTDCHSLGLDGGGLMRARMQFALGRSGAGFRGLLWLVLTLSTPNAAPCKLLAARGIAGRSLISDGRRSTVSEREDAGRGKRQAGRCAALPAIAHSYARHLSLTSPA